MAINFDILLSGLSIYPMDVYRNTQTEVLYNEVRFLFDGQSDFKRNTLYLGKTTMLLNKSLDLTDIGLILIKDCEYTPLKLQVDLALFSGETDMFKLFDAVLNILSLNRKIVDSSASLLNSLIQGKGLNYIVQVGSEILGNPVFLVDASSKLLASSANTNILDTFWNDLVTSGYGNDKNLVPYVQDGLVDKVLHSHLPVMIDPGFPNSLKRIVGKIQLKENTIGYIGVLENSKKLTIEDIHITGLLCDVVASEMQKSKLYDSLNGVRHEFLLIDLLEDRIGSRSIMKERSNSLFNTDYANLYVIVLNLSENIINSHTLGYLRWSFESLLPFCKSVYYCDQLILVINAKDRKHWEEVRIKLIDILKENNLDAGLSLLFHDMEELKKYYNQAVSSNILGRFLKSQDVLHDYEHLYIYDLLTKLKENTKVNEYVHPSTRMIKEYDKSYGTDYYNTLYEYLICAGNITKLSSKLFLHRNTVVHRMNKISEITGVDLDDGNNRFKLLLSYRIMELPL